LRLNGLIISMHGSQDRSAYTHRLNSLSRCLENRGGTCHFLYMADAPPLHRVSAGSIFMPFWIRRLRRFDFIHCGATDTGQAMYFCRFLLRQPVILDIHGDVIAEAALANEMGTSEQNSASEIKARLQYAMAIRSADHFLTVSAFQTEALVSEGIPQDRITLIRNGVDLAAFSYSPEFPGGKFTFAYAGGFQVWQAIDTLIEAFEKLDNPDCRLLIVGFSEVDKALKDRLRARLGSRVDLVDRADRNGLVAVLRAAHVLAIPRKEHLAIRHAFPTKFAEYAALGKPVLVNDVDETANFVRRYGCGFVSGPSVEAMTRTMSEALRAGPEVLQKMGARARIMAEENFSWEIIGDAYADCVRYVVERYRKARVLRNTSTH